MQDAAGYRRNLLSMAANFTLTIMGSVARAFGISRDRSSLRAALFRRKKSGLTVSTVIDVGASDGRWSTVVKKYFPEAVFFLVEAQKAHETSLKKLAKSNSNFLHIIAAASDKEGEIYFEASDLFGGVASIVPLPGRYCRTVSARTIDGLVREYQLEPPYLLKLDTHGFEIPILEGAMKTLENTHLIIIETYNFKVSEEGLRFPEMCHYMENHGFRCIDLCDPMFRPKDGAFWQMDLFFAPQDSTAFLSNTYD